MTNQLNFEVQETPVLIDVNGQPLKSKEYKAIYRDDTNDILNVSKKGYVPMKNSHFEETVSRLSNITGFENKGFSVLKKGGVVLAHLKNNGQNEINGNKLDDYLLVGNSHDGSMPFFIGTTTVFISCTNQFSKIVQTDKVRHTKSSPKRIEDLLLSVEAYYAEKERLVKQFQMFNDKQINKDTAALAVEALLGITPEEKLEGLTTRKQNILNLVNGRVDSEMNRLGNNVWGLFNGFTYYHTHDVKNENKGFGVITGTAYAKNKKGFEVCEKLLVS